MENVEMRERVLQLLESYRERTCKIALLRYELTHPGQISETEMIEAMAFAHGDGTGKVEGHVSNKTLYIALNYQEQMKRANHAVTDEIASRLVALEQEQNRLTYYVTLLEKKQAEILGYLYFDGMTLEQVEEKM